MKEAPAGGGQAASVPVGESRQAGTAPETKIAETKIAETKIAETKIAETKIAEAGMPGEAGRTVVATRASEEAPAEASAPGEKFPAAKGTEALAKQQPAPERAAGEEAALSSDRGAGPATEVREPRTAQGTQRPHDLEKGAEAQAGATPKASAEEAPGTKIAQTAATAKFVPLQAGAGQGGAGDAGKKGDPEQKAQGKETDQVQSLGMGAQAPAVEEAAQPETKPAHQKSALHESILSQIKDRVVTHDGKGNGRMSIRLNPGELGELKIEVRMEDNRVRIEVQADNRMVKDLLMSNLDSLKEALTGKNFTMEGFDVSTGGGFNNQPMPEERASSRQQARLQAARAGGYSGREEKQVNYLTAEVNNLLDVRF